MIIDPTTNRPEQASMEKSSWSRIDSQAAYTKKEIKSGAFSSKCHRHPGECRPLSAATVARKIATAAKIEKIRAAGKKYNYLMENESAKVTRKDGVSFVNVREKGRFTGQKIVF